MKAFVLAEPGKACWKEAPEPLLSEHGAILRPVAVTPCTSDINTVYGTGSRKPENLILGHECVALIEQAGSQVKDFKPGDFVAVPAITPNWEHPDILDGNFTHAGPHFSGCQLSRSVPGVFAEHFYIPHADLNLAKIPEGVSVEAALMCVDVVTTGFTAVEAAEIQFGDDVCVFGIGAIGLAAIMGAGLRGAGRIFAVGSRGISVKKAYEFGATEVIDYHKTDAVEHILALTQGKGVDSVIIAGGGDKVMEQAVDIVKYGTGIIANVNHYSGDGSIPVPKFSGGRGMAGKTIKLELAKGGRRRIERLLSMAEQKRFCPEELITHTLYGFKNIETAMDMMKDKASDLIKVMVCTDEEFSKNWSEKNEKNQYSHPLL